MFIRHDAHRTPLQRPYDSPFQVIAAGEKTFRVQIGNREELISIDRLKPAHLDPDNPPLLAQPPPRGRPPNKAPNKAINNFPRPHNVKSLQEFLGMINFYHRFIPNAASILRPLYLSLKGNPQKHILTWLPDMVDAFQHGKSALAKSTLLAHPHMDAPLAVTSDASDNGVGAVFEQLVDGFWQPLAFFSKQLRDPERKYSTFDRELLALYLSIRHFRFLLEGRSLSFTLTTNPLYTSCSNHRTVVSTPTAPPVFHIGIFDRHQAFARQRQCCCRLSLTRRSRQRISRHRLYSISICSNGRRRYTSLPYSYYKPEDS